MTIRPLVLGAGGQIGGMLRRLWQAGLLDLGAEPIWHARVPIKHVPDHRMLVWDMLKAPAPDIEVSGVICLSGGPNADDNAALAAAALAVAQGKPLLFASTQAVYGPQAGLMSEQSICKPTSAYGAAKLAAETVLRGHANAIALRIGNVVGADALSRAIVAGDVVLDQFADGSAPKRMMIGVQTLGQTLAALLKMGNLGEPVINLAQPGLVGMDDMLIAAGTSWRWTPAPDTAIPALALDPAKLASLHLLPDAVPARLIAEARLAGWQDR